MGVPELYGKWIRNIPGVSKNVNRMTGLSIDVNGTLHKVAGAVYGYSGRDMEGREYTKQQLDIIKAKKSPQLKTEFRILLRDELSRLVNLYKPDRYLCLCVDGPAPIAKISQQRNRRFASAVENDGKKLHGDFDTSEITPGTTLMKDINKWITEWIHEFRLTLPPFLFYSPHNVRGEGEHKIFDIFNNLSDQMREDFMGEDTVHGIYGMDADLSILSSLSSLNIFWLREDLSRETNRYRTDFISVDVIKNYIISNVNLGIEKADKDQALRDFILLTFLIGDDFVPGMFTLNTDVFRTLELFIDILNKLKKSHDLKLVDENGVISLRGFHIFCEDFIKYEKTLFNEKKEVKWHFKSDFLNLTYEEFADEWAKTILFPSRLTKEDMKKYIVTDSDMNFIVEEYLRGLQWNMYYYMNVRGFNYRVSNWRYYFSFSPIVLNIADYLQVLFKGVEGDLNIDGAIEINDPDYTIAQQLFTVIHDKSSQALPKRLKDIRDEYTEFKPQFPASMKFFLQARRAKQEHMKIPILPPLNYLQIYNDLPTVTGMNLGKMTIDISMKSHVPSETVVESKEDFRQNRYQDRKPYQDNRNNQDNRKYEDKKQFKNKHEMLMEKKKYGKGKDIKLYSNVVNLSDRKIKEDEGF